MNLLKPLYKLFGLAIISLIVISCQEDFNSVGTDIIADPNFEFDLYDEATVIAYSRRAYPVQTNNLPVYQLGVYNDPVFGVTEASVLAQVTMNAPNPSFGENPEIERVILSIPYFSTAEGAGENITYTLDSVFGNAPVKLSVYESNFFLRDLDPGSGFDQPQKYYSNQGPLFQNFLGEMIFQADAFLPSDEPILLNEGEEDEEQLSPRLRVELDEQAVMFFKEKIIDREGSDVLLNNTNFKNYFRGLYFIAEANNSSPQGHLTLLDITNASIDIIYSRDNPLSDEEGEEERIESTFGLAFDGIIVNTFENNIPPSLETILNNPNTAGADNLYLKGGAGTITVIELFGEDINGNNIADELEDLRDKRWIINEANLILNVNQDLIAGGSTEPERLLLYDLNNNTVLVDYHLDNNTPANDPLNYKTSHLGRLQRGSDGKGKYYKLRLTNHLSNLINKDSTNVRLGLVVSQNVSIVTSQSLQNTMPPGIESIPAGNVISPEGTILHGSNPADPEKRIKLNIYYTEINN